MRSSRTLWQQKIINQTQISLLCAVYKHTQKMYLKTEDTAFKKGCSTRHCFDLLVFNSLQQKQSYSEATLRHSFDFFLFWFSHNELWGVRWLSCKAAVNNFHSFPPQQINQSHIWTSPALTRRLRLTLILNLPVSAEEWRAAAWWCEWMLIQPLTSKGADANEQICGSLTSLHYLMS